MIARIGAESCSWTGESRRQVSIIFGGQRSALRQKAWQVPQLDVEHGGLQFIEATVHAVALGVQNIASAVLANPPHGVG